MNNFKITKTILENINEQNNRINECIDIVNGYTTDKETNENRFTVINEQLENIEIKIGNGILTSGSDIINTINSILLRIETLESGATSVYGNILISTNVLNISEGASGSFTVKLDKPPSKDQTVNLTKNNDDVSLSSTSLTFTPTNYNIAQTVTITVSEDNTDYENETCIITLASTNVSDKNITVNISDNDTLPLPQLKLSGDFTGISADNKVTLNVEMINADGTKLFENKKCKLSWQGSSSLNYSKKNYSISLLESDGSTKYKHKFFDDVPANDGYHLKANFIDASHSRNVVSARLWKDGRLTQLPNSARGVIDGFPIVVYENDVKKGLYTFNLKQHKTVYGFDESNSNHLMFRAETQEGACAFKELSSSNADWEEKFPETNTQENRNKLNRLIGWVKDSTDEQFIDELEQYFNKEYLIDYYIYCYFGGWIDSLGKNFNILTYDGNVWYCAPYDMDSTWGLSWNGTSAISSTVKFPSEYECSDSVLWSKVGRLLSNEIKERYKVLRETILNSNNVTNKFENFINLIPKEEYSYDQNLWTDIPTFTKNAGKDYITNYIGERSTYVDNILITDKVDVSHIVLDKTDVEVEVGNIVLINATVYPLTATNKNLIWESNNSNVVVDNGKINGVSEGVSIVTCRSVDNSEVIATCNVSIIASTIDTSIISANWVQLSTDPLLYKQNDNYKNIWFNLEAYWNVIDKTVSPLEGYTLVDRTLSEQGTSKTVAFGTASSDSSKLLTLYCLNSDFGGFTTQNDPNFKTWYSSNPITFKFKRLDNCLVYNVPSDINVSNVAKHTWAADESGVYTAYAIKDVNCPFTSSFNIMGNAISLFGQNGGEDSDGLRVISGRGFCWNNDVTNIGSVVIKIEKTALTEDTPQAFLNYVKNNPIKIYYVTA